MQIYYTYGKTKTELLEIKNKHEDFGPLRYKNACIFSLSCESESNTIKRKQKKNYLFKKAFNYKLIFFRTHFN